MQALLATLAQAEPGAGALNLLFIIGIFVVFYFLLIRPQQKRARQHRELISAIGTGDRIVTIGGLHGTVQSLDDDTMRLELAPGTVVTVTRQAIARRLLDADEARGADHE